MSFRSAALSSPLLLAMLGAAPGAVADTTDGYRDDTLRKVAAAEAVAFAVPNPPGTRAQTIEVGVDQRRPDWTLRTPDASVRVCRDDYYPNGAEMLQRLTFTVERPGQAPCVSHFTSGYEPGLSHEYVRLIFTPTAMAIEAACPLRTLVAEIPGCFERIDSVTFVSPRSAAITLVEASATVAPAIETSGRQCASTWRLLDSDLDTSLALPGGDYRLGLTAPDTDGSMEIIYLGGARTNSADWTEGAVKGRLRATRFAGHYDLVWQDATGATADSSCFASLDDGILTLRFPVLKATLRFSRE